MAHAQSPAGIGLYWRIWLVLLGLTVGMIVIDGASLPLGLMVGVLVVAMLAKAGLIASYFMHLRYEGILLILSVLLGLAVLGFILWGLMVPDGHRIMGMLREGV
ncbi:MAG: cytochrome C oxidase subunit IV family protein [Thermoanaerobaculia bacterium]|nr:cytochrome C oxidase subunit IV family protein [Thermoanaerobaculia bacterium]